MRATYFFGLLLATCLAFGQFYTGYDWAEKPVKTVLSTDEKGEPSVGILDKKVLEFIEAPSYIQQFETVHTLVHVNNEDGIQRHNRVYIPMYGVMDIVQIKARTVNKAGKVTLLNEDNIKEIQNVEEYGDFKIFAIEGVEPDSDIEVLYTLEKEFYPFGTHTIQSDYRIRKAEFTLIHGESNGRLKAYRTSAEVQELTVADKRAQQVTIENVPIMIEEEYATPQANRIGVAYHCFHSQNNLTNDMIWRNVTSNLSADFFPRSPARQVLADIQQLLPNREGMSEYEVVARVDDFIKTNYTVVESGNPQLKDINYIMKNRTTNDSGIMQVYGHYFRALGISYQAVVTANRFLVKFDPEFFTPNAIQDFLIFIPSIKQYVSPARIEYRIGEAPFNILGNMAVFVNPDQSFVFGKIEQIDPNYSRIVRKTVVTFEDEMESVLIEQEHDYYGHWAVTNRAVYQLSPEADRKEFEDYLTASGIEDKEALDLKLENTEMFQPKPDVPFRVFSKIRSQSLLEEAGDNYIFEAGLVIGTQSELYQERKRMNPIEMQYPNQYNYTIEIEIPEGYKAEGLESLKIFKKLDGPNGPKCKFESTYRLEEGKIIVSIEEYYRVNEYPIEEYEGFREVINAASDFNKASILFRPE